MKSTGLSIIWNIAKRELYEFFYSPMLYIVVGAYLVLSGIFTFPSFFDNNKMTLRSFFEMQPLILILFASFVTMRLFSEEKRNGCIELLLTLPVSDWYVVIGKYVSAVIYLSIGLLFTFLYTFLISPFGTLDWGASISGYLGIFFTGCIYLGIGLFASSITKNQIISVIISVLFCLLIWGLAHDVILEGFSAGVVQYVLKFIGVLPHSNNFARGVIDFVDLAYYGSWIYFTLFATRIVLAQRH